MFKPHHHKISFKNPKAIWVFLPNLGKIIYNYIQASYSKALRLSPTMPVASPVWRPPDARVAVLLPAPPGVARHWPRPWHRNHQRRAGRWVWADEGCSRKVELVTTTVLIKENYIKYQQMSSSQHICKLFLNSTCTPPLAWPLANLHLGRFQICTKNLIDLCRQLPGWCNDGCTHHEL